ncbi:hypothetical protein ACFWV1_25965 [Streptomyces sp. NPDC058700]
MPATDSTDADSADLPVHDGDTPPENQVSRMATADDLADRGDA